MLIKEKALSQALKMLDALGCQYKVITSDGDEHGTLQASQPKRKKNTQYEHGARSAYIKPYLASLEVGEVAVIPRGPFTPQDLQASVSSLSHKFWGAGSYSSAINGDSIELLRIA